MCCYTVSTVIVISIAFLSSVLGDTCNTGCEVLVNIDSGPVCGRVEVAENSTKFYSFQGIPYGKPPTGARRFAELEPIDKWIAPLYAYEEGPACPTRDVEYGNIPVKRKGLREDCIYANVFVPATANLNSDECDENLLPILVNIHGGGFQTGSGNRDLHGPELLLVKDVIVINFNYRLAAIGFLSLGSNKIPGNAGLRDMVTLLKWVQRNARAFGGDPNRVTAIGNSAGAASLHLLLLSQAAKGLIHKAVLLSGTGIPAFYSASPKYAKHVADMFLTELGINTTDPDEIHHILTKLPLEDIMRANDVVQFKAGLTSFVPVVEKEGHAYTRIVEDDPIRLIAQGRGKDIPMVIGFNQDEAEFFRWVLLIIDIVNRYKANSTVILPPRLAFELPPEEGAKKAKLSDVRYFDNEPTMDGFVKSITECFFQYPALKLAQFRSLLNAAPTYLYVFGYESDFSFIKRTNWLSYKGTAHVEDLTYVFRVTTYLDDHVSIPPRSRDDHMRDWMSSFISNYVKCDNPTCTTLDDPRWPPINKEELMYQMIREPRIFNQTSLSDEIKGIVKFCDSIDDQLRILTEKLQEESSD